MQTIAEEAKNDEIPVLTCCQDKDHKRDTVFNVALTVGSHLEKIVEKVKSRHGVEHILVPIISTIDCRLSVIKSCCGNIIHTLLDRKSSLNGFEKVMYFFFLSNLKTKIKLMFLDFLLYISILLVEILSFKLLYFLIAIAKVFLLYEYPKLNLEIK